MVKQAIFNDETVTPKLFSPERIGKPQILAGLLLLAFMVECGWLVAHIPAGAVGAEDLARMEEGLAQWHGETIAGTGVDLKQRAGPAGDVRNQANNYDHEHSPLRYLIESAPLAIFRVDPSSAAGIRLARLPYILIAALLGASLWYVSRRLYGNAGGYIALSLYCFSPTMIRGGALWLTEPNMPGAWGAFGAVFTAIAVAHTLYAPREVVLWNWRRILLLGISIVLAVGSQFSLAVVVPVLLAVMLYVAHERKAAALTILLCAASFAAGLLFGSYFFHGGVFVESLVHARWIDVSPHWLLLPQAWVLTGKGTLASGPVLVMLLPAAMVTYAAWRRSRYFGNTVPLALAILFLILRAGAPHETGGVSGLIAVVFLFLFVAGIAADLMETRFRDLAAAVIAGLLMANAVWNLFSLAQVGR